MTLPANVTGTTSYNADNEQSKFKDTSLSYDANGNLTGGGTNAYTWDARNHLTQITQRRPTVGSFVYDAFGRRVNKSISGTTTQFLYDGPNPVQELNASNVATANLLTGLKIDEFFSRADSSGARSFLTDILGSTLALTDASGTIQTQYTYEPFGNATVSGAANGNSYQFTGRENDGAGLDFYRARYYSPTFQRFIAQDPIDFKGSGPNLYAYVLNNPASLIDPLGSGFREDMIRELEKLIPGFSRLAPYLNEGELFDLLRAARAAAAAAAPSCTALVATAVGVTATIILISPGETACTPEIESCAPGYEPRPSPFPAPRG